MTGWTFLTYHARVLLCVAHDPAMRLRDIAASLDITERSAFGIITDLVEAGYTKALLRRTLIGVLPEEVRLRAETDVLVLVSNCPQINNPCNGFDPTPVRMVIR